MDDQVVSADLYCSQAIVLYTGVEMMTRSFTSSWHILGPTLWHCIEEGPENAINLGQKVYATAYVACHAT